MANYEGYLLKFGDKVFPNAYILEYSSTPNQRLESSADRDNTGTLQRKTLNSTKTSINLSTHILRLNEKIKMQSVINAGMVNSAQRKCKVTYWNDEDNTYKTGYFYIADVEYTIMDVDSTSKDIQYNPITIELIEY